MKEQHAQSVYKDSDDCGLAFVVAPDGRCQLLDQQGGVTVVLASMRTANSAYLVAEFQVGKDVGSKDLQTGAAISDWSSCFGDKATGTLRARERRALRLASTQALLDLLNRP